MIRDIKLPPEIESGNKEYKLKIIPDNEFRLEQLASQMKWRINEGNGVAFYYIGVNDNGSIAGISKDDFSKSMKNLNIIVKYIITIFSFEKYNTKYNYFFS